MEKCKSSSTPVGTFKSQNERREWASICQNCDSLAVVAVAPFDPHLAGQHLAAIGRDDNCFYPLQPRFLINILQNKNQFDHGSLKKLICSYFTFISSWQCKYRSLISSE